MSLCGPGGTGRYEGWTDWRVEWGSPRTVSGSRGKSREEWGLLTLSTPVGRAGFEQGEQRIRVGETETQAGLPPPTIPDTLPLGPGLRHQL